ncbi:MAG: VWA domain-containing protein, partial [Deltaproteobacteria bacterium]|nr:VWA domain-containing protein [Deltaproteobacteria bacterium]
MIEGGLTWQNGSWWWAVVLGVALLVAARLFLAWWRGRTARRLADSPLRGLLTAGVSPAARAVSAAAVLAAVALLGVAALRPQYGLEETEWTRKGLDVAIALDLSASMLTRDLEPDRLGASVLELEDLLGRLNGGRVGLVPFAGVAFQQCPLTSDFGAIRIYLRDLSPADLPVPGTAVGRALTEAMDLLGAGRAEEAGRGGEDEEILHPFQGSKYKVIVLITDGEDHGSEPLKVAERARDLGIRIYTLGVGDPRAGDLVPEVDADTGKPTGDRLTDEDTGEPVVSRLNEDLLRQIAELTDGAYFHYSGAAVAPALFEELDRLEKREVEATLEKLRKDRFQLLVAPALALLALGLALPGGRRRRGAVAAVLAVLALPACGLFETTNAGVDEANERYHAEAFEEAAEGLETLRDKIPEAPELHYDLGTARLAAGDLEGAVEAFQRALEKAPPPLEARIRANLGLAHLRAALAAEGADRTARLQQAVAALRDAVRLDAGPEEPRKNLELAVLHLSPPCERRQESWEPNDRITRPTHWTPEVGAADLLLCPSDQDFYTVQVPAGHRLQAWLAGPGGGAAAASPPASPPAPAAGSAAGDTAPEAPPLPPRGSPPAGVSLELVEGASGLADSASLPASPDGTLITRNVSDAEATWTLRVFAPDDEEHAYRLGVRTLPACETLEDGFEPNDTREAAADLPGDKAGADGVDGATTGADDPGQEPSEADAPLTVRLCPGDE